MTDRFYIGIIIRKIEKKLNWKKVSLWTDNEYKKLGLLIYKDTSISISPQTLKRLFGKVKYKGEHTPQPATKDALAKFLDYDDWEAFIKDQAGIRKNFIAVIKKWNSAWFRKALFPVVLLLLLAISFFYIRTATKNKSVIFFAENVIGTTPHTVSFKYNISNLKGEDVYINFDEREAEAVTWGELLDNNRTLINHCYESPGFYNVTISSKGTVLASAKILAMSDGWCSYYFNDDNFSLRKFVFGLEKKVSDITDDGILYISPDDLKKQGFNGSTVFYLENLLYKDFHISADSCTMEVKYRNSTDMGGISCYDVEFRIIGENGLTSVILVQKGCYRWSEIIVGEKQLNGKYNDLSFLSADLSSWNILSIITGNNKALIINNSDTIFTTPYNQLLGQVKGIRFLTKGSGAFDYVRLYNKSGELMFDDNFDN